MKGMLAGLAVIMAAIVALGLTLYLFGGDSPTIDASTNTKFYILLAILGVVVVGYMLMFVGARRDAKRRTAQSIDPA